MIDSFAATETVIELGTPLPEQLAEHGVEIAHLWADKGYAKVYTVPAGKGIMQHKHRINHDAVLLLGRANLIFQGRVIELIAPTKVTLIAHHNHGVEAVTDIVWACVWPDVNGLTDPDQIDQRVIA